MKKKTRIRIGAGSSEQSQSGLRKALGAFFKTAASRLFTLWKDQPQSHQETVLMLTDFPSAQEITEIVGALPTDYTQRFEPDPLDKSNMGLLVGRESELKSLAEVVERWRSGKASSVAVVGPSGTGKTTLLNYFEHEFESQLTFSRKEIPEKLRDEKQIARLFQDWFGIEPADRSLEALIREIRTLPPQIILVEEGHNLMLRTLEGGKALKLFCYVVMETRANCLWIVTFKEYPWRWMDYQHQISRYFTHRIETPNLNPELLEEAILTRHQGSGYRLYFSDGEQDAKAMETALMRDETNDAPLKKKFFEDLHSLTGGNLQAALFFWLLSLRYSAEHKSVAVMPCLRLDYRFLQNLDLVFHFTLAEIIGNGCLTPVEHAEIFRLDIAESRLILDYLNSIRIVNAVCGDDPDNTEKIYYEIHPAFYQPVRTILEGKNILY